MVEFGRLAEVAHGRDGSTVDVLYGDSERAQRVITRFLLSPSRSGVDGPGR